ncbi:arsenate reductase ArsC [Nocardia beijingensis]|uniref:Arsenate reductase ArsC n=2 Tax=Nocardia TaxID=1817 RepID=A0ABU6ASU7_9NOCA|nr:MULTISPECIES: arsenate reductase ArsC [Nocardia]MBF6073049.1 arsenate reductase ArsC [Nocardia beijingensis]MBF6190859.1 arsenate reductase ArsC [Nocardia beijingensis]MEA3528849.1 arsenate reductase ArsC [Nocardia sp. CDC192]MEB3510514.1 arsenate reductase ArsC [Nocardia sp. CDC186]
MSHKPSVLFVCEHNAGRSQMAAGFLTALAGHRFDVRSAGSAPAETLNATVVDAMAEIGIDISGHTPKPLTMDAIGISDVVVTMGAGDACPFFPGISYRDWMLPDPADQTIDVVRTIRDRIRILVENLIAELVPAPAR